MWLNNSRFNDGRTAALRHFFKNIQVSQKLNRQGELGGAKLKRTADFRQIFI